MKKTKGITAVFVSAIMTVQLMTFGVPAAFATDSQTDIFEELRSSTNLYVNGDLESGDVSGEAMAGNWVIRNSSGDALTAERTDVQSYDDGYSLLIKKSAGGSQYITPYVTQGLKPNTAYVSSVMVLGTEENLVAKANDSVAHLDQYRQKFYMYMDQPASGSVIFNLSENSSRLVPEEIIDAPSADTPDQEKLDKSYWKMLTSSFVTKDTVPAYAGMGIHFAGYGSEIYADNYYLGELMVADISIDNIGPLSLPLPGENPEEVTLEATALNQLGNSKGLENSEFVWELTDGSVQGIELDGNVLTITDEAEGGEVSLTVTCIPDFAGAENQSEDITMYRTKNISVEITALTEEEKAAALLGRTNLIDNGGFESSQDISDWSKYGTVSVSVSDKQAYEGSYSMLINGKGAANAYTYKNASGFRPGATYIMSAMVLGTENNADAEPDYDDQWINKFSMMLSGTNSALAESVYHNEILPRNLSGAPLSTAEEQSKLPPSEWKQLFRIIETKEDVNEATLIGPSVYCGYLGLEYYVDNYYVGELIVSNVENTTASDTIQIPLGGQSPAQLNLTAKAYNQLGTEAGLEGSSYVWELTNGDVEGVSISDGVLTVDSNARIQTLDLTATCVPGFAGADTQTDSQKSKRTVNVSISLTANPSADRNPVAKNVRLTGDVKSGETLELSYDFWQIADAGEGDSVITWYKSDSMTNNWVSFNVGGLSYTIPEGEDDLFYKVGVVPKTDTVPVLVGQEAYSPVYSAPVAPTAQNVTIVGTQAINETWSAKFDYLDRNDDEQDTPLYQWYISESESEGYTPIDNASADTYTVTETDAGKYIKVGITPVSKAEPTTGDETFSAPRLTSAVPEVKNVSISKLSGTLLTASYTYYHPLGIPEGSTVCKWYRGTTLLGTGLTFNASGYDGDTLTVVITPYAEKMPYEGPSASVGYTVKSSTTTLKGGGGGGTGGGSSVVVKPVTPATPSDGQTQSQGLINVPSWAESEVSYVISQGIMQPARQGDFGGSELIARSEFMAVILRAAGLEATDYRGEFTDVNGDDTFSGLLQTAVDKGIISKADAFFPERNLARDEMCKILVATLNAALSQDLPKGDISQFTDASLIQPWAQEYIEYAVGIGLAKGVSTSEFAPRGTVTRAQAAVTAKRIADYIKGQGGVNQ